MVQGGNFTTKAQEAVMSAQNIAQAKGQQQVDTIHLLNALLNQKESIPSKASAKTLGQVYLTQDMAAVLERAQEESVKMGDEFISIEHFFLALLDTPSRAKEVLDDIVFLRSGKGGPATMELAKIDYDTVLNQLVNIRGGEKITDPEPESK